MKRKSLMILALLVSFQFSALADSSVTVGEITVETREITVNFAVTGLSAGDDVTILVYKKDGNEPGEGNIVFIDQVGYADPQIQFPLFADAAAGTYQVMMGGIGVPAASVGEFVLVPLLLGDVNGDGEVTALDAVWILKYTAGATTGNPVTIENSDVNKDGEITALDAVWILKYTAGGQLP